MALAPGDTFFAPWPEKDAVVHLFFVISDPALDAKQVVVVPLMTWDEYKEQTCVLVPGDHPFIRHRSYIDYGCAKSVDATKVERSIKAKQFRTNKRASDDLLRKIREGADRSDFLPLGLRDILEDQDLVNPL